MTLQLLDNQLDHVVYYSTASTGCHTKDQAEVLDSHGDSHKEEI